MPTNKFTIAVLTVAAGLSSIKGIQAADERTLLLRLKGQVGDSWLTSTTSTKRTSFAGQTSQYTVRTLSRTFVEALLPGGRMTLVKSMKVLRWQFSNGNSLIDYPSDRELLRQIPGGAEVLASLDRITAVRFDQDRTGEVRANEGEKDSALTPDRLLPAPVAARIDDLADDPFLLPYQAIRVGDGWDERKVSIPFSGLGKILVERHCELSAAEDFHGEKAAMLLRSGIARAVRDEESGETLTVDEARFGDLQVLALDRGHIVGRNANTFIRFELLRDGKRIPIEIERSVIESVVTEGSK